MFCIKCATLAILESTRICVRCQAPITNNLSCICDKCSTETQMCSVCLKKAVALPPARLRGCGCGKKK